MRNHPILIFILLIALITTTAFVSGNPDRFLKKHGFRFIPATANDHANGFYIFESEISNGQYRVFLNDLKANGRNADYAIAMVDTLRWRDELTYNEPYVNYYFQHEAFENYPVVNISYDAAVLYCQWLTQKYAADGYSIEVMLPDSTQWKTAARGGIAENKYAWTGDDFINKKGFYRCNFKRTVDCSLITAPVLSFEKNNYGLYNMCGNVSEILREKGYHKGGGWGSDSVALNIDAPDEYKGITKASPFIGFRPVAVIK